MSTLRQPFASPIRFVAVATAVLLAALAEASRAGDLPYFNGRDSTDTACHGPTPGSPGPGIVCEPSAYADEPTGELQATASIHYSGPGNIGTGDGTNAATATVIRFFRLEAPASQIDVHVTLSDAEARAFGLDGYYQRGAVRAVVNAAAPHCDRARSYWCSGRSEVVLADSYPGTSPSASRDPAPLEFDLHLYGFPPDYIPKGMVSVLVHIDAEALLKTINAGTTIGQGCPWLLHPGDLFCTPALDVPVPVAGVANASGSGHIAAISVAPTYV